MLDNYPIDTQSLEKHYGVKGKTLQRYYKNSLSEYNTWQQKEHAEKHLLFPDNLGSFLSIDETALSNGELYTILTNKAKRGKKGSIIAIVKGTKASDVINLIRRIPLSKRNEVKEVTLDMAASMNLIVEKCFHKATRVTDRFHVQKLASEAVQEIRIKYRWEALEEENKGDIVKTVCKRRFSETIIIKKPLLVIQILFQMVYISNSQSKVIIY